MKCKYCGRETRGGPACSLRCAGKLRVYVIAMRDLEGFKFFQRMGVPWGFGVPFG
jgi:hypothetical protein